MFTDDDYAIPSLLGFPVPPPIPRPYNLGSGHTYLSQQAMPLIHNTPFVSITDRRVLSLTNNSREGTALLCEDIPGEHLRAIGTAVLISPNMAVVARHCIESRRGRLKLFCENVTPNDFFFDIVSCENDPNGFDISIVTINQHPGISLKYVNLALEEQPRGRYFMSHYAGGTIKQLSTGDFVSSEYWLIEPNIFIAAGPCASGAGVFNMHGNLIGISIQRTLEYHAMSRKVVLLAHSKLFKPNPFSLVSPGSALRPYTRFVSMYDRMQSLSSPIVETYKTHKYVPHARELTFFPHYAHFRSTNLGHPIPWDPQQLGTAIKMGYDQEDYEAIRESRVIRSDRYDIGERTIRVNDFVDIDIFLTILKNALRNRTALEISQIPKSFLIRKDLFEVHQEQHMLATGRRDKSIFSPLIASRMNNPVFVAFALCLHKIASEYYNRNKQDLPRNTNFVIDLGFNIGNNNEKLPVSTVLITNDAFRNRKFHIYPVDSSLRVEYVEIDWPRFREEIRGEYNNGIRPSF